MALSFVAPTLTLPGPAGQIEAAQDKPRTPLQNGAAAGCVIIAHPHPLHAGTMNNKVVHTVSRAFQQLGYTVFRFNFRGVEGSDGVWDEGRGEIEDMKAVVEYAQQQPELLNQPIVLAGFSFGGYVASHVAQWLSETQPGVLQGLVLVSPAVATFPIAPVQPDTTLLIHGGQDDVVLPEHISQWAISQGLPISVVPAAGHFFHGQLPLLKDVVIKSWQGVARSFI